MFDPKLRVLSWNADGVRGKISELLYLAVHSVPVDLIALCETKLTSNIVLPTPGFACYRKDKRYCGKGQGVAILVRLGIEHSVIDIPATINIEAVGISPKLSGVNLNIISAYQSPNLPLLQSDLDTLLNLSEHVIVLGDLNANHSYWQSSYTNTRGRQLFRHMMLNDYYIYAPDTPTQVNYSANKNATTPDLVLCRNVSNVSHVNALIALSSNHYPIHFSIGGCVELLATQHRFCYNRANWKLYRSVLDENIVLKPGTFKSVEEVDHAISHLQETILKARNIAVPTSVIRSGEKKLPHHIRRLIAYKNYLRRVDQRLPKGDYKRYIRRVINNMCFNISNEIKANLDDEWNKKLAKVDNPSNDIWRVAQTLKPRNHKIPPLCTNNGSMCYSEMEKCEALASAFLGNMQLTLNNTSYELEPEIKRSVQSIDTHAITVISNPVRPAEVQKTLSRLKSRKSPGDDEITNTLIKNISRKVIVLLTIIFNSCLCLGYFPSIWKNAKVIALKKPGKNQTIPTNYRPISLLPSLGKLFEKIIYTRLLTNSENLLIDEQLGFRSGHSCAQQLARVSEHISHSLNLKQSTGMFLLDIEKAFDTVWHNGLLHKLVIMGIPVYLVKLIKSYLTNRKFAVFIGKTKSSSHIVPAGVPQGSILGPYLFLLYLNDLPIQPRTHLACFADDTASYTSSDDIDLIISRLQFSLDLIHTFFTKWILKLNALKTEAILFTRQRCVPKRTLIIDGHAIPWSHGVARSATSA